MLSLLSGAKLMSLCDAAESLVLRKSARSDDLPLTWVGDPDSFVRMIRERTLKTRQKLVDDLPVTGELLRGSLLERTIRHTKDCPKCARGEGHRVFVLTVSYGGGRTRQFSVRRERVTEVRRLLANYQKLKKAIEGICELNHELLRPDAAASKSRRKQHD